jgi:hypothetical protein
LIRDVLERGRNILGAVVVVRAVGSICRAGFGIFILLLLVFLVMLGGARGHSLAVVINDEFIPLPGSLVR